MRGVSRLLAAAIHPVLAALALVTALWHVVTIARIFASRLTYPMDIEWMEGGALLHGYRFLHGQPIYGPPSQGFLPFPYPPGHFLALGIAGLVAPLDYASGRAVSILFFLLACTLLALETRRHFQPRRDATVFALLAVGGILATFAVVGGWYDLIRNDSMAIALALLGAALVSGERLGRTQILAAAGALTAAVYTKQTAIFFIAWLCVFVFWRSRFFGILLATATGVLCVAVLGVAQWITHGRFWMWTVLLLSKHFVDQARAAIGLRILVDFAPFVIGVPVVAIILAFRRRLRRRTALWIGMYSAALPASLLPFAKAGGFLNNLIPIVLLAPPVAILVLGDVLHSLRNRPRLKRVAGWFIAGGVAAFLALRRYDAKAFIVTDAQRRSAAQTNAQIAALDGGVVIPNHPFLAIRNGVMTPQFHEMPYEDAMGASIPGLNLPAFVRRGGAEWAILSGAESPAVRGWINQVYKFDKRLVSPAVSLTGFRSGPRDLLRLRPPLRKKDVRVLFDFEEGTLDGWVLTGNAFDPGVWGARGGRHVNSWHPTLHDAATGKAVSPSFTIDRSHLGLLVAGGQASTTRVEIRVEGRLVEQASGVDSEAMIQMVWDMSRYAGRRGSIAIVDDGPGNWGHVLVDQVELFDLE